jgi:hypothetical protein
LAAELARLRERFAGYERLDQQLEEMVTGLTELLQGAAELRRRTNQDIVAALTRCEDLIAGDRVHQRALLASLFADVDAAQRRTAAVTTAISRLQTQLGDLSRRLPPADTFASPAPVAEIAPTPATARPTPLLVAIENVPNVSTALAPQRFIAALDAVTSIHAREFAAGKLQLEIARSRSFAIGDLRRAPYGTLAVLEEQPDRLRLRYDPPDVT